MVLSTHIITIAMFLADLNSQTIIQCCKNNMITIHFNMDIMDFPPTKTCPDFGPKFGKLLSRSLDLHPLRPGHQCSNSEPSEVWPFAAPAAWRSPRSFPVVIWHWDPQVQQGVQKEFGGNEPLLCIGTIYLRKFRLRNFRHTNDIAE